MPAKYAVLRFSAAPEQIEPVNVALLVDRGTGVHVVFDENFPRLTCFSPDVDRRLLARYLQSIESTVRSQSLAEASATIARTSSQFVALTPVGLPEKLSDADLATLSSAYLDRTRLTKRRQAADHRIEARLNHYLTDVLRVGHSHALSRAKPSDFLSPEVVAALKPNGLRVAKAISGRRKVADLVADREGRELRLATVLFGQVEQELENDDHKAHAVDMVRRSSNHLATESFDDGLKAVAELAATDLPLTP